MKSTFKFLALALLGQTFAAGCGEHPAELAFPVLVTVVDDHEDPVSGAVFEGGGVRGTTDTSGAFQFSATGLPGSQIPVKISCPSTHTAEGLLAPIELRALYAVGGEGALRTIEYRARCQRTLRSVVVAIQAREGLPILVNGQSAGSVDASGVFHKAYHLLPGSDLEVKLDTSQAPRLRPQNPSRSFRVEDDAVLIFAQAFQEEKPMPKAARTRPKAIRHIPQRL